MLPGIKGCCCWKRRGKRVLAGQGDGGGGRGRGARGGRGHGARAALSGAGGVRGRRGSLLGSGRAGAGGVGGWGGGRKLKLRRPNGEKVSIAYHPESEKVEIGSRVRQQQLFSAGDAQKLVELAEEWASERGWNQETGRYWPDPQPDSNIPIYDFSVHGKIGKGLLMDKGSQGLWPLARHACDLLERSLEEGFRSSADFCSSVSITKLMPGDWQEQRSSVFPGYRSDVQSLHVQLSAPEASEGGDLYLCQQMPPTWREYVTRLDFFNEFPLFQYLFDSERLKDPTSPCQFRPLSQGAAISQVGGRVGGISPVTKGATYFLTVSYNSGLPKPAPYSKEPYGPSLFDNMKSSDIFAFLKFLRYFMHGSASGMFPERFVQAFQKFEVPASEPGRDSGNDESSLLEDLSFIFSRALKKSEAGLASESLKSILHVLSHRGRTSIYERNRFKTDLNGQTLVLEGLEKYGSDTNFRDISCSVLKKLPCIHDTGRLDLGISSTCEGATEACSDFEKIGLEDLAPPNFPKEQDNSGSCVEGMDHSFGSSEPSKMSDECVMQAVMNYKAMNDDPDVLTPGERRAKMIEEVKELEKDGKEEMARHRQSERDEFLRKMRGEL